MRLAGERPLLVILGPTAVGKTSLGIRLAQQLDGEIISADSRQVYRYMDIGTAKPTPGQLATVPHHLIDVVDPDEQLSLAQFQERAYAVINDLHARGKLPLLVGGTGLYITAVIEGWSIPEVAPNPELRAELEAVVTDAGVAALYERLRALDPVAAEKVDANNPRRVIRALEIRLETGETMDYEARKQPPPYHIMQYGLTMDRAALRERADHRLDDMMARGFLDEVRALLTRGYDRNLPSMSGLGYRQLAAHLVDAVPLDEALRLTRKATHAFIRRQYGWFRGHDSGIHWLDVTEHDAEQLAAFITEQVEG